MLPHGLCNYLCSLNPNLACRDEAYEAFPDSHVTRDLVAMIPAHDMRNEPKLAFSAFFRFGLGCFCPASEGSRARAEASARERAS